MGVHWESIGRPLDCSVDKRTDTEALTGSQPESKEERERERRDRDRDRETERQTDRQFSAESFSADVIARTSSVITLALFTEFALALFIEFTHPETYALKGCGCAHCALFDFMTLSTWTPARCHCGIIRHPTAHVI